MTTRVVSKRPVTGKVNNVFAREIVAKTVKPQNNILILGITLDATLSFSRVYPHVFFYLRELLNFMEDKKGELNNIKICYQILLLHDAPEVMMFSDGGIYSSDEREVLNALKNIDFYGGGKDGTENLNRAVSKQLHILNQFPQELSASKIQKGMLFFTDSIPSDDEMMEDFSKNDMDLETGILVEKGVRYAHFFAYTSEYMPVLRIVDEKGEPTENNRNISEYSSMTELLDKNEEETVQFAKITGQKILEAFSEA